MIVPCTSPARPEARGEDSRLGDTALGSVAQRAGDWAVETGSLRWSLAAHRGTALAVTRREADKAADVRKKRADIGDRATLQGDWSERFLARGERAKSHRGMILGEASQAPLIDKVWLPCARVNVDVTVVVNQLAKNSSDLSRHLP